MSRDSPPNARDPIKHVEVSTVGTVRGTVGISEGLGSAGGEEEAFLSPDSDET